MSDKLANYIRQRLNELDWSQNRLAKEAEISSAGMSKLMNGYAPSISMSKRLAKALNVETETILRLAGRLSAKRNEPNPEVDELVILFDQLDEADKDDILAMARLKAQRKKAEKRGKAKV